MALLCAPAPTCGGIGTSAVLGEIEVREHRSPSPPKISRAKDIRFSLFGLAFRTKCMLYLTRTNANAFALREVWRERNDKTKKTRGESSTVHAA